MNLQESVFESYNTLKTTKSNQKHINNETPVDENYTKIFTLCITEATFLHRGVIETLRFIGHSARV